MTKHIVLNKSGMSMSFDPRRWNTNSGGVDAMMLWAALAAHFPDCHFWIATRVNLKTADRPIIKEMFPRGNVTVIDQQDIRKVNHKAGETLENIHMMEFVDWLDRKGVKPDGAIMDMGTGSTINLPRTVEKAKEPGVHAKPPAIGFIMGAPAVMMLNVLSQRNPDFKWLSLHFDPKSVLRQKELIREPVRCISQMAATYPVKRQKNGVNVDLEIEHFYGPLASTMQIGHQIEDLSTIIPKKRIKLAAAINGANDSNGGRNRWNDVMMILDSDPDAFVFGKWLEEHVPTDHHGLLGTRLPGPIPKVDLDSRMKEWKYTVLTPASPGWISGKFYEVLAAGVVPIFTPDYDGRNKHLDVPDLIRMNERTPQEVNRIISLIEDSGSWEKLITMLRRKHLPHEVVSGREQASHVMSHIFPELQPVHTDECVDLMDRIRKVVAEYTPPKLDMFD